MISVLLVFDPALSHMLESKGFSQMNKLLKLNVIAKCVNLDNFLLRIIAHTRRGLFYRVITVLFGIMNFDNN